MIDVNALLEEAHNEIQKLNDKLGAQLKEFFKEFWELNPNINAVVWQQYAPSYNDGNPCVFSVHDIGYTTATGSDICENIQKIIYGEYVDEEKNIVSFDGYFVDDIPIEVNKESIQSLEKLLNSLVMENVMEDLFGSSVTVIATRKGFEIEEYEDF